VVKPLFIPLKTEFFAAFEQGSKTHEMRPYGKRWNESVCFVGRAVVLSKGYGKSNRLYGRITGFERDDSLTESEGWRNCYGDKKGPVARIDIEVLGPALELL
jgi:hypothetical protein